MQDSFQLLKCLLIISCFTSCSSDKASEIVDACIQIHGGPAYENFSLEFDFRGRHYTATRDDGIFTYTREFSDSSGMVRDILSNDGFTRLINGNTVELSEERTNAFRNSVNSVIYFALLPFGLNDPAVNKKWLGDTTLAGQRYHLIEVTFDQRGGGKDHEDVFLYWIHSRDRTMDYLAYTYQTDGGGVRMRSVKERKRVGGILFQDYLNFKPPGDTASLYAMQGLFEAGNLEKLSEIELENLKVK